MHSQLLDEQRQKARARHAFEHDARSRQLKKNWFIGLVFLWIAIWGFVGLSGIVPRPLWVVILGLLVMAAFAIALFAPRNQQQKPR